MLGVLTQEQLAHSLFPLGDTPKSVVRAEAARRGLAVADKPDSHDICFISDGDTGGWLSEKLGRRSTAAARSSPPTARCSGPTRGRRATRSASAGACGIGTPAADGQPRYVLDIEPVSGTVTVGPARGARRRRARRRSGRAGAAPLPTAPLECTVQLRAHGDEHRAVVDRRRRRASTSSCSTRPQGIAPGQAVVVYDGTRVVGSATISATRARRAAPRDHRVTRATGVGSHARRGLRRGAAGRARRAARPAAPARAARPRRRSPT